MVKITTHNMELTPAYNRDYTTAARAEDDFRMCRDFVLNGPGGTTYCSINDFQPGTMVTIRFNHDTMATVVTV